MKRTIPLLLLCVAAGAADVRVPSAPPPAFADTESVTRTASATGGGAITNLPPVPPSWAFSRDWTAVRLVVRGVDGRDESVSVRLDTDPAVMVLR